jgi:ketosteroid isomerase-like protein
MNTKEVLNAYYEWANAGDWDKWLTLFDENVVVDEQLAGHAEGKNVFVGAIDAIKKGYAKFIMHPKHTIVEGELAAVIWDFEGASADGVPMSAHGANYFEVKNGLITYMSNHHDSVPFKPFTDYMASH